MPHLVDHAKIATLLLWCLVGSQSAGAQELPLTGPAFVIADEAYKAYARGDYAAAADRAREAIRLRPDVPSLKTLLANAESAGRGPSAARREAGSRASTGGRPEKSVANLTPPAAPQAAADPIERQAYALAESGYRAYDRKDYSGAAAFAAEAVRLAPTQRDYRYLLVNALLAADRVDDADAAATQALSALGPDAQLAAQQEQIQTARAQSSAASAYRAFDAGDFPQAVEAAREATRLAPSNRNYQALLANALFSASQYAEAEEATSRALAGQSDALLLAQRGYIRQRMNMPGPAKQDFESALAVGSLPVVTEIGLLVQLGRKQEAKSAFEAALSGGRLRDVPQAQVAYLAASVGDDAEALAAFDRADATGQLKNTAYQDAAFAALRSRNDAQAIGYFKRTVDEVEGLRLQMAPQLLFDTRRAVAEVSRDWGIIASLSYRGAVSGFGVEAGPSDSIQGGVEAYWRPWGYNNGQYAEVFVRGFETLHSNGGATGLDTLQTAVGLRYKPLTEQNLVVSLSRVMSPRKGRNDWLAQLAYSADRGTDLRIDVPSWWTARASGELGRYLNAHQSYALADLQLGRSFRLGDEHGRWVLFPHLSLAADYDSAAAEQGSAGIGPGITARYWFREDAYSAPRSYADLSVQYRARLSGAARAKGLFIATTLSY